MQVVASTRKGGCTRLYGALAGTTATVGIMDLILHSRTLGSFIIYNWCGRGFLVFAGIVVTERACFPCQHLTGFVLNCQICLELQFQSAAGCVHCSPDPYVMCRLPKDGHEKKMERLHQVMLKHLCSLFTFFSTFSTMLDLPPSLPFSTFTFLSATDF